MGRLTIEEYRTVGGGAVPNQTAQGVRHTSRLTPLQTRFVTLCAAAAAASAQCVCPESPWQDVRFLETLVVRRLSPAVHATGGPRPHLSARGHGRYRAHRPSKEIGTVGRRAPHSSPARRWFSTTCSAMPRSPPGGREGDLFAARCRCGLPDPVNLKVKKQFRSDR